MEAILRADAAIAAQMVPGLVEPHSSGQGGGALLLHFDGARVETWDGRETAPAAAERMFLRPDGQAMGFHEAAVGGLAVGVPGLVAMLEAAHRRHGQLPWADLFEPAIVLAEQGFEVGPRLHRLLELDPYLKREPLCHEHRASGRDGASAAFRRRARARWRWARSWGCWRAATPTASRCRMACPARTGCTATPRRLGWPTPTGRTTSPTPTSWQRRPATGTACSIRTTWTSTVEDAFGARQMVAGLLLNNQLTDFSFQPRDAGGQPVANRVEPSKRPRSSMTPTLVFERDSGRLLLSAGSPGGTLIPHYLGKTPYGSLHWGLTSQDAADLPNFGSLNGPTRLERGRFPPATLEALRRRGHELVETDMTSGVQLLQRQDGGWLGGADPRREGVVLGD